MPFTTQVITGLLVLPLYGFAETETQTSWERASDWSVADTWFPHLHLHGTGGFSSGHAADLASGGHDPRRESFSAQAIEPGLSLRTEYLEGFSNYLWFQDEDGDWDGELEEAFGKITRIPGGLEFKGGQFLSRVGALNDKHLHAWDFVDAELAPSRFLGEDGLLLRGGELSWTPPTLSSPYLTPVFSLGYGNARSHDHAHGEEGHGDEEHFEAEEGVMSDDIWTARAMLRYRIDDFHSWTGGLSWAGGENGFGRDSEFVGLDLSYHWRENGLDAGGRAFQWRNEILWRAADAFEIHDDGAGPEIHRGNFHEWGMHSHAVYTWHEQLDTSLRIAWVEGVEDFDLDERLRVSPAVSWWFDPSRRIGLRGQYNFDAIASGQDEHSLWLQLRIALGSLEEVR
ncbi:MAG: hypothetical protein ACO3RV_01865 [Luteolibacter sp.]